MNRNDQKRSTPRASSLEAHERMANQLQRDTKPEIEVRRAVHALGLRYRVNRSPFKGIRSKADMIFLREKIAVFIDGCFWHGCPEHGTWPKANASWWREKIKGNKERDQRINKTLEERGWKVIRIWEHENPNNAALRIRDEVFESRIISELK